MFICVQLRALAGPLKEIQRRVPKPLRCCLGCEIRFVVLLEGEPLPYSEVLSTLEQVFHQRISLYFAPLIFPSILTILPVPAAEQHSHSMMLPPQCFSLRMVSDFSRCAAWHSGQRVQSWFHQTRESCFPWSEIPLGAF